MNILMFNFEFPPLGGGAGNATFYMLKEFARYHDLHIDVIVSSDGTFREEQFSQRIKIFFLDIGKTKSGDLHYQRDGDLLSYAWKSLVFSKRLIKKNKYDLCHAFFGIPCGFIARSLGLPYIVSLRGSDVPYYNPRFYWWDTLLFKRLCKGIWGRAARVIANSGGLRSLAQKSYPAQTIDVIGNGIDCDEFRPAYSQSETLRIICVSRLIARKGIEYLLEAVAKLKNENIEAIIVGDGDQKERLSQLARELNVADKVRFLPYVPHAHMSGLYNRSDVFVLPSLNEGMSNAVLEAMASGLPVIHTDTGGTQELIRGNGFIVPKKDPGALADTIDKFLQDDTLAKRLGEKSRQIALKMSWQHVAKSYYDIYVKTVK